MAKNSEEEPVNTDGILSVYSVAPWLVTVPLKGNPEKQLQSDHQTVNGREDQR